MTIPEDFIENEVDSKEKNKRKGSKYEVKIHSFKL